MDNPIVTVVTPFTFDRKEMYLRLSSIVANQDYEGTVQHICDPCPGTIGAKLNGLIKHAQGQIIIRCDSDDLYASDWITKSVRALQNSKAQLVGLSSIYYNKQGTADYLQWVSDPRRQQFICGATMCFYKSAWEQHPFENTSSGEDGLFQQHFACASHGYTDGFLATLHETNTQSHKALPLMKKVPANKALNLQNRWGAMLQQ